MNSIFNSWKRKQIVTLVETVKESKLWIISNAKHPSWAHLDSKLKKSGGSSYKKFHSLLKKFAETERVDGWKFYDLMLEHFPHYAKENQVESQQQQQDEFRLDPMSPQVDAFKNFFNDDTQDSVMMSLQQQNWLNEDISSLHQDDPDRIFINELMKDMKELDEEAKSMFKIKAQTLMHGLKYNRMLL